jgi:hypothetical protein
MQPIVPGTTQVRISRTVSPAITRQRPVERPAHRSLQHADQDRLLSIQQVPATRCKCRRWCCVCTVVLVACLDANPMRSIRMSLQA